MSRMRVGGIALVCVAAVGAAVDHFEDRSHIFRRQFALLAKHGA